MRLKDLAKKALNKRHLDSITLTENDMKEAQEAIKKIEECIKNHGKCEGPLLNFGDTWFGVRLSSKKVRIL